VSAVRFRYSAAADAPETLMPRLPLTLSFRGRVIEVVGLLDTGSAVNVLPYPVGLALGAVWDEHTISVPLVGSLGRMPARALVAFALHPQIAPDTPVRLVFAWTRVDDAPLIFGQMNFFAEFDVCFYRSQEAFDVRRKGVPA
jgi:hypothetical protein